jgi:hypothetical protein
MMAVTAPDCSRNRGQPVLGRLDDAGGRKGIVTTLSSHGASATDTASDAEDVEKHCAAVEEDRAAGRLAELRSTAVEIICGSDADE